MNIITAVTQETLDACLEIRRTVFIEEQNVPLELEIDEQDTPESDCTHFLVLDEGRPVGTFRCPSPHDGAVHVQRFCFLKDVRMRHFGKRSIEFIEAYYKSLGVHSIALNAQCPVIPFYEKCGFHVVSDVFDDAGIPHRAMIKNLQIEE